MEKIEQLAADIASLSDSTLSQLAQILAKDHPRRAEVLEYAITFSIEDTLRQVRQRLDNQ